VKIVVGLGNPGDQYAKTRHNIGWMVLDRVADRAGWSGRARTRDASAVAMGRFHGLDLTLVKPLTYMNDSGRAVRKVLSRSHAPIGDLLVVADDFALPFGKLRFREGGGPGGHNGLRSIIEQLGNKFARVRMGIGRDPNVPPGKASGDAAGWVLSDFPSAVAPAVEAMVTAGGEDIEAVLAVGITAAMNQHNGRPTLAPA
jgi:PTH1 family peptidyl-tRNA hydrolase